MPNDQRFLLTDALELFLLDAEARNLAQTTRHTYSARLTHFVQWCGSCEVEYVTDVTTATVRQYQLLLLTSLKDVTAKNRLTDVKTFLRFCVAEELIERSPADRVRLPRVAERLPRILSPDDCQALMRACRSYRDRALLLVMLDTAARASEICSMDFGDVDLKSHEILIRQGKPRRDRIVYVSAETRRALFRHMRGERAPSTPLWLSQLTGRRLPTNGLAQALERVARRAGVKGVTPHTLRRTAITSMLRSGMTVFEVMKISGHRSVEALEPYVALAGLDAKIAHERASPVTKLLKS